ncbi:uncharacterized protein LOC108346539 [Vigna angularis]|uniref:uncharacterized protein LOC108346539 n=1 Tax=Phaseolus angularis TaxID=3914 RepID=UPI000809B5DF|nr:uncharacterized protein LOC108346539 [Vigna angularis]
MIPLRGLSDIEWLSEELNKGLDSEDDDDSIKISFSTFSMPKSLGYYKWEVGTYFAKKKEFTDAIRTYTLSNGRNLKFVKNDKKRVSVKCGVKAWQLRKVIDHHNCSRDFNVKLITSKWLSERMEKVVKENPNMKVMDIREKVSRKWNVGISRNMTFRARAIAKDTVEGSFKEQFKRIYDYGHELMRTNQGSIVQIKVENTNGEVIFKRFYACLKACKDSFICCRPIIGLNGCFLKGKYGGELLTAARRDGNEQILPIAYFVVEDLGGEAVCASCTFIQTNKRGLLSAIQDLLPG